MSRKAYFGNASAQPIFLLVVVLLGTMFSGTSLFSQGSAIMGAIIDGDSRRPIPGASITLKKTGDTLVRGAVSDNAGRFRIILTEKDAGKFNMTVRSVGFAELQQTLNISPGDTIRLGRLELKQADVKVSEVQVEGRIPPVETKGDTTEYKADAYKVQDNASAEDLLKKMPGVQVDASGNVQAQGEQVRRVLVDGKPFFGEDPSTALRNLPADMVDKMQVIDAQSDQARFTGFDDGDRSKLLNIVTRQNRRNGIFGKLTGGYGTDDRYVATATVNFFNDKRRISVLGLSNNINQQNFSIQDIVGAMTGGSGGGRTSRMMAAMGGGGMAANWGMSRMMQGQFGDFFVPQSDGISSAHALGVNFSDSYADDALTVSASYFVNSSNNDMVQDLSREFFLSGTASQINSQADTNNTKNLNHRFNARLEYTIDSSNLVIFSPRLTLQQNKRSTLSNGDTRNAENLPLNASASNFSSDIDGSSFGGELLYRYKFPTQGRTLSLNVNAQINDNSGESFNNANNFFFVNGIDILDTLRQFTPIESNSQNINANVSYTEPLHEQGQLQISYNISRTTSESDRNTFDQDSTGAYTEINNLLSNQFKSFYTAHRAGVRYNLNLEQWRFSFGGDYQVARLEGDQLFPTNFDVVRNFNNFLPNISIRYDISQTDNLRLNYRTSTNQPSVQQLQNVINNSDPIRLSTGNPNLEQEFYHNIFGRYSTANPFEGTSFFAMMFAQFGINKISNSTFIAQRDTLLNGDVPMGRGAQLNLPINMDGYFSARSFAVYSFPFDFIKSNVNVNAAVNYSRELTRINSDTNTATNLAFEQGIGINSNISPDLDFSINARLGMNFVRNSLRSELDNNFFTQTYNVRANYVFWEGFSVGTELAVTINSGLTEEFNQTIPFWNLNIGKQLFNRAAEIKLTVFDVLRENNSIRREVTPTYIQDTQTNVLQQYALLTFTYYIRSFGG